jgi:tRNA (guanine37-N1)-methyltransferase
MKRVRAFDLLGNIAILKFPSETSSREKKKQAEKLLRENKNIKTVLEKSERIKGRLRKLKTKWLAGYKTKEALYRENNCVFRFNVDSTYFSPRLSNERIEIAKQIKKTDKVLVMFSGISPYAIVIAKISKPRKIIAIELNKQACKYAQENVKLNKLDKQENKIELIQGDVKKVALKLAKKKIKFDKIVMPRPQLKETFLKESFALSKKHTVIYYYGFAKQQDAEKIKDKILNEAKKAKKKIKILQMKKAGEIAPYKYRYRVDFTIL